MFELSACVPSGRGPRLSDRCGRRARPPSAARWAARCRAARRARAPPRWSARLRRPSSCRPESPPATGPAPARRRRAVAAESPVQVSTRSPSPASPASVSRCAAERHRQPREFGQAARDERGQRVMAEAEAFDHARRNRDDVLQRAADLDADHVAAAVEAQRRRSELRLHGLDDRPANRRRPPPRSAAPAPVRCAKLGPDNTTISPASAVPAATPATCAAAMSLRCPSPR